MPDDTHPAHNSVLPREKFFHLIPKQQTIDFVLLAPTPNKADVIKISLGQEISRDFLTACHNIKYFHTIMSAYRASAACPMISNVSKSE